MAEPLAQRQPATATDDTDGRLAIDVDGGLVRLRARYDPELVAQLRTLPGRRFIRARREWVLPAKREALAQLASLVEQLGDAARPTERARRRLERARPGRIDSREGEFELCFPYNARLLERVRSIPERSYRRDRRRWTVPPTRAGALALLALLDRSEFTAEPEVAARLRRLAAALTSSVRSTAAGTEATGAARRRRPTGATSRAGRSSTPTRTDTSGSTGSAGACACGSTRNAAPDDGMEGSPGIGQTVAAATRAAEAVERTRRRRAAKPWKARAQRAEKRREGSDAVAHVSVRRAARPPAWSPPRPRTPPRASSRWGMRARRGSSHTRRRETGAHRLTPNGVHASAATCEA